MAQQQQGDLFAAFIEVVAVEDDATTIDTAAVHRQLIAPRAVVVAEFSPDVTDSAGATYGTAWLTYTNGEQDRILINTTTDTPAMKNRLRQLRHQLAGKTPGPLSA